MLITLNKKQERVKDEIVINSNSFLSSDLEEEQMMPKQQVPSQLQDSIDLAYQRSHQYRIILSR